MVLCALTVDLDAYTGAETHFLLLIRFLSLNLYWNPSQAIIHMRMVYLLWAYISLFLGKPHHFHFKTVITISEFIPLRKWQKWMLLLAAKFERLNNLFLVWCWNCLCKKREVGSSWHLCGQEDILLSKVLAGRQEEPPHHQSTPASSSTSQAVRSVIYLGDIWGRGRS